MTLEELREAKRQRQITPGEFEASFTRTLVENQVKEHAFWIGEETSAPQRQEEGMQVEPAATEIPKPAEETSADRDAATGPEEKKWYEKKPEIPHSISTCKEKQKQQSSSSSSTDTSKTTHHPFILSLIHI